MKSAAKSLLTFRNCLRNAAFAAVVIQLFGRADANPVAAGGSPTQEGALGTMPSLRSKSDLFGFFHFASTGKTAEGNGRTVESFKPTGEAFRALVTLYVTTDEAGNVQKLRLVVARSFIDDPSKGVFAGDLAKTFLGIAAVGADDDNIGKLAREIRVRSMNSGGTVISAQPIPRMPEEPSVAYMTYAGKGATQTLRNRPGSIQVELANGTEAGKAVLEITESPVE